MGGAGDTVMRLPDRSRCSSNACGHLPLTDPRPSSRIPALPDVNAGKHSQPNYELEITRAACLHTSEQTQVMGGLHLRLPHGAACVWPNRRRREHLGFVRALRNRLCRFHRDMVCRGGLVYRLRAWSRLWQVSRTVPKILEGSGVVISNNAFERSVGKRGPRLAAAMRSYPAAQLGR